MATFQLHYFCLVLLTFVAGGILGCRRSSSDPTSAPDTREQQVDGYTCGICGQQITVNLIIRNRLQNPLFEFNVTVETKPQRELIHFLEAAATMDPRFKYSADYHGSLGYMITMINKVSGSTANKTYWNVIEHPSGNTLDQGVSSYVPDNTQTLMFNFTTWDKSM